MSEIVLETQSDATLRLTLNAPERRNAFDGDMSQALLRALDRARDASVRVVILAGTGAFSAGQDLEAYLHARSDPSFSIAEHLRRGFNAIALALRVLEKPVIAEIGGVVAGAGLSIALACDLRVAGDDARFTSGFSRVGLIPDGGASLMLPTVVGLGRALELAMTSDLIDAAEAHRIGLVNRVVVRDELQRTTAELAATLAAMPSFALAQTKRAFNRAMIPSFAEWLDEEAALQERASEDPEHLDRVRAFLGRQTAFGAVRESGTHPSAPFFGAALT